MNGLTHLPLRKFVVCTALLLSLGLCAFAGHITVMEPVSSTGDAALSDSDLRRYLESYGWELTSDSAMTDQVTLPETFGPAYEDYLACQRACGLPLEDYAGQEAERYTYMVANYPTGESTIMADLLICDNTIIGGDIRSADLDGFMHSLLYPAQ